MLQLNGHVTKFVYEPENTVFRVALFRLSDTEKTITVAGELAQYRKQTPLVLYGEWTVRKNKKTGEESNQFKVSAAYYDEPLDVNSLELFLASAVRGCGPTKAKALVQKHGIKLFDYLKTRDVEKLIQAKGIGPATATMIAEDYQVKSIDFRIASFLASLGVDAKWAPRIQKALGMDAVNIIQRDPYRLTEVNGIGFEKADSIALKMGWKECSPERVRAILMYELVKASGEGHCYLRRLDLVSATVKNHAIDVDLVNSVLDETIESKSLIPETVQTNPPFELTYLPWLHRAESSVARRIRILLQNKPLCRYTPDQLDWLIRESQKAVGIELTDEQHTAVRSVFLEPISILTGGPGTGKTSCQKVVVDVARRMNYKMALCAPTGRAAKHLSNTVGEKASTLHMLLEYDTENNRWRRNEGNPVEADLLICDETSMVDISLASKLFEAVKIGTPVLLIGDKDQLPAVSPGRVLEDLIDSKYIPVTRLTKIFRQAAESLIITNAHRILNGEAMQFPNKSDGVEMADCYLLQPPLVPAMDENGKQKVSTKGRPSVEEDKQWIKQKLLALCKDRIPARLNIDPVIDIQVLTPMKERGLGTHALNEILQEALNPKPAGRAGEGVAADEITIGSKKFRTHDRVMQYRNNYRLEVSNGDIGFIKGIDFEAEKLIIDFYGEDVQYPFRDAVDDLQLAYACTVHKAQGSESPVIIILLFQANYLLLQRNLLYTAATRAKRLLVIISPRNLLDQAIKRVEIDNRNSFLKFRLRRELTVKQADVAA